MLKVKANTITLARIILLPIPCAVALNESSLSAWVAFFMFTLLGATDFIDGYIARKEGPTKLGALIDPIADKIFTTAVILTMTNMKIMPKWAVIAILIREFFLAGLRSSSGARDLEIKTSKFAKIKTIFQMGGFGTIFLTSSLPEGAMALLAGLLFLTLALFYFVLTANKRKIQYWISPVALAFLLLSFLALATSAKISMLIQILLIVSITWASGIDYIASMPFIFKEKKLHFYDFIRIYWAIAHSISTIPFITEFPKIIIPSLICLSFELATGGIDAVAACEKNKPSSIVFFITGSGAFLFLGAACFLYFTILGQKTPMFEMSMILACLSCLCFCLTFKKWKHLFKKAL